MTTTLKLAVLLALLGLCLGRQHNYIDYVEDLEEEGGVEDDGEEEIELVAQPSKYGSLWPLPQKVESTEIPFKLSGISFKIVDAKESSAGPSCSLLQNAYRRSG